MPKSVVAHYAIIRLCEKCVNKYVNIAKSLIFFDWNWNLGLVYYINQIILNFSDIMEYLSMISQGWDDLMYKYSDPRVKDWFLMSSPLPTMGMCLTYVFLVKVRRRQPNDEIYCKYQCRNNQLISQLHSIQYLGPKLMENRKPFKLRNILIVYNFAQVLFSIFLFHEAGVSGWFNGYSLRCQPVDYSNSPDALQVSLALPNVTHANLSQQFCLMPHLYSVSYSARRWPQDAGGISSANLLNSSILSSLSWEKDTIKFQLCMWFIMESCHLAVRMSHLSTF